MTEELLHLSHAGTVLEHVNRAGVTKDVRGDVLDDPSAAWGKRSFTTPLPTCAAPSCTREGGRGLYAPQHQNVPSRFFISHVLIASSRPYRAISEN